MTSTRRLLLLFLLLAATAGAYVHFAMPPDPRPTDTWVGPTPPPVRPRPWRWPTQDEWVVHEVARRLESWAGVGPGRAVPDEVRVKPIGSTAPGAFVVTTVASGGPRLATVKLSPHAWDPAAYTGLARQAFGDGAETSAARPDVSALLAAGDARSLREASRHLSEALLAAPRDPALHEAAALLWSAHALREHGRVYGHDLHFLNGITAHLAAARALSGGSPAGPDGTIAGIVVDVLLDRQVEAMAALDALPAADATTQGWARALRLRVTRDPRRVGPSRPETRLERREAVLAIAGSYHCGQGLDTARRWGLEPSGDVLGGLDGLSCGQPERAFVAARLMEANLADARELLDLPPGDVDSLVERLQRISDTETLRPEVPRDVVPPPVLADAALAQVAAWFRAQVAEFDFFAVMDQAKLLAMTSEPLRAKVGIRPLIEAALEDNRPSRPTCERYARLVTERPDLVVHWPTLTACPTRESNLLNMVDPTTWVRDHIAPGTGRVQRGPWQGGLPFADPALAEAQRRAPWNGYLSTQGLIIRHFSDPPPDKVRQANQARLEYDLDVMRFTFDWSWDSPEEQRRLCDRMCALDADRCASCATMALYEGYEKDAVRMWTRALDEAGNEIGLSADLIAYVGLLLDRGDEARALAVARRAADTYSGNGLETLGYAFERLGRYDDAIAAYRRIYERYENSLSLQRFYVRRALRGEGELYPAETKLAMAEVFPEGVKHGALKDWPGSLETNRPRGYFMGPNAMPDCYARSGMGRRASVITFNGIRVQGAEQFYAARQADDTADFTAVVMHEGHDGARIFEVSGRCGHLPYSVLRAPAARAKAAS